MKIVAYPKKTAFYKETKINFFTWIEIDEAWNVSAYINKLNFRAKILLGLRKLKYWNYIIFNPIPIGLFSLIKIGGGSVIPPPPLDFALWVEIGECNTYG